MTVPKNLRQKRCDFRREQLSYFYEMLLHYPMLNMTGFYVSKVQLYMKYMLHNMRPIETLMNPTTRSTDILYISEFVTKIEKLAMLSYTDDLERIRRYLFQHKVLLEHFKSVFRFAIQCISRWVGYFGNLLLLSNSSKLHTNPNILLTLIIFHHLFGFY